MINAKDSGKLSALAWVPRDQRMAVEMLERLFEYNYEFSVERDQLTLAGGKILVINSKEDDQVRRVEPNRFVVFNDKIKVVTTILTETEFHDLYEFAPMAAEAPE